jgi:uncharacterized protein YcbK (DUF882 family)
MSQNWSRRRWIRTVLAGGAGLSFARLGSAEELSSVEAAKPVTRSIELFNTHTSESLRLAYKSGNEYDPAALARFNHLLRDHRNGETHEIDPRLFDQLHDLALAAHCDAHYEIISGFRSQASNDKMSARPGSGVAKKSLHMQGRALDVRLKGCPCSDLRDLALAAKQGGVGYYKRSDFVHIDTGAFRTWEG